MGPLCARWVALHLLGTPWLWLAGLAASGLWALAATLGPPGISTGGPFLERAHYEVAFLGLLLGVSLGTLALARHEALLERATAPGRLYARTCSLLGAAALGLLMGAGLPFVAGSPLGVGAVLGPSALAGLHLVGMALVALEAPLPPAGRSLLVPGAAWLAPALLAGSEGGLGVLVHILEASRPFASAILASDPQPQTGPAPILAWFLAATLLATRGRGPAPPPQHALRHPR